MPDPNGDLALHLAICADNADIACQLIAVMNPAALSWQNKVGDTPLHLAIERSLVCLPSHRIVF
jgi:ankyrin repeat protein